MDFLGGYVTMSNKKNNILLCCQAREERLLDTELALHEIMSLASNQEVEINSMYRNIKNKRIFYIGINKTMEEKVKKILKDDFKISVFKEKILIVESILEWIDLA